MGWMLYVSFDEKIASTFQLIFAPLKESFKSYF